MSHYAVAPEQKSRDGSDLEASTKRVEGLLRLLAAPQAYARRDGEIVEVIAEKKGIALVAGRASAQALAGLLSSGAVHCLMKAGQPRFVLTEEGRAAFFRLGRGDEGFRDQHRTIETVHLDDEAGGGTARRNLREDPLALLARQEQGEFPVSPAAVAAGERLRRDIHQASLPPKTTSNWDRLIVDGGGPGSGLTLSEAQAAARARVNAAMVAVGPDFAGILFDLCGFSRGIGDIEKNLKLPARSAKVVLALGLRMLARHYGFSDEARGAPSQPIRRWGTPDSRPDFPR
ncbi:MAG: DUF6456 domain-containing protein [Rhabdaerophilum sp.]